MKERIEELMQLLNLSPTQFALQIGVQRSTLQHILSGRNEPSLKIVTSIHNSFPDVNLEWLINGTGSPVIKQAPSHPDITDMPLFPELENQINATAHTEIRQNSILTEEQARPQTRKRTNNKDVKAENTTSDSCNGKHIKEVVIFFEDGTYQKFLSELKK